MPTKGALRSLSVLQDLFLGENCRLQKATSTCCERRDLASKLIQNLQSQPTCPLPLLRPSRVDQKSFTQGHLNAAPGTDSEPQYSHAVKWGQPTLPSSRGGSGQGSSASGVLEVPPASPPADLELHLHPPLTSSLAQPHV